MAKTFVQNGINAAKEERKDFARQCFFQAIVQDDKSEMAWLWLASVTDSQDEKISHLQKVLNINPVNENALSSLASVKNQIAQALISQVKQAVVEDKRDEAQSLLQKVLQESPNSEDAWLLKAHLSDSYSKKLVNFEKVLEINSDNEAAKAGLDSLNLVFGEVSKPQEQSEEEFENSDEQDEFVEETEVMEAADAEQEFQPEESVYQTAEPEEFSVEEEFESFENEDSVEYSEEYDKSESEYSVDEEQYFAENEVSYAQIEQPQNEVFEDAAEESLQIESVEAENSEEFADNPVYEQSAKLMSCPFCSEANEPQSFMCKGCSAILSLSDIEMVLGHEKANNEIVGQAVGMLEAEKEEREFDVEELKVLGIGYLNLKDLRKGFSYLQEAAQANNGEDVVLISQVDALAIRIAEIEQQQENKDSEPKCANILVVDDSPTVRKLISSKLEKCGHEVVCAVDGMDALAKIEEAIPDLILLDITMPRMDGYQVCKLIRSNEATQNIPIVMISGNDGFFDKVRGKMAGTTNYITKPFGPETLMKAVNEYVQ
jgi:twitching motility two-component system response regulator PilG